MRCDCAIWAYYVYYECALPTSHSSHWQLNEYFINVTTNTYANITTGNLPAVNNLYSVYRQSFPQIQMAPVTTKEIIKSLPWKNSSGYDEIPLGILKISMPLITSPRTYLCNKSISKGSFPTRLKYSQITPIFKKGDQKLS